MTKFEELTNIIARNKNKGKGKAKDKNELDSDNELEVAGSEGTKQPLISWQRSAKLALSKYFLRSIT